VSADKLLYTNDIDEALRAVGELLEAAETRVSIVVIGGAALQLLGIIDRATRDVDIVALTDVPGRLSKLEKPPKPLPLALASAISQVARDFGLPENWMNGGPANQWDIGLPPGFADRVHWRTYRGLDVGIADRLDLIFLKLEAAADQPSSDSRHFRDLIALDCTDQELAMALEWAQAKNVGDAYHTILDRVITHVTNSRGTIGP
jgi:hypothetical protein